MRQRRAYRTTETHSEVVGIHVQFLRVHNTQTSVGGLDVVQVLHGSFQPTHDGLTVSSHFRVTHDSGGTGKVSEASKVSLSPWSHDQKPETKSYVIERMQFTWQRNTPEDSVSIENYLKIA